MSKKVFISHCHRSQHAAVELQNVLEKHGAQTFLDQDRIEAADYLPARIREGIAWCDCLLLLWSGSAAKSTWVKLEWEAAYEAKKKIIPYVLDGTPLPSLLENLVYVEASDQQHGNALLLGAVLGPGYKPGATTLFPGRWQASMDAFGIAQATYDLELRANGQVEGSAGADNTGILGNVVSQAGMGGLLSVRYPLHGSWSYDEVTKLLTIDMTAAGFGREERDTITVQATGHEGGAISGHDFAGRQWTLRRVGDWAGSQAREAKRQEIREAIHKIIEGCRESGVTYLLLIAYLTGVQTKCDYDLGLPLETGKRLLVTEGDEFSAVAKEFWRELEQGGWMTASPS